MTPYSLTSHAILLFSASTSIRCKRLNAPFAIPHVDAVFDVLTPYQMEHYLFIDGVHLTTAGQAIEADMAYAMVIAPSQMSLLAESAVQNGWAHAATIQGQLDPGARHCGSCGRNVWTSAGTYSLEVQNAPGFPGDSGTPFGGTVGIDYQTEAGFVVGAAFTSGSQVPAFSTGGHFSLVDVAPSLYAGYVGNPCCWWNAVLTYDSSQYDVARAVPLGSIFTDQNHATTTGQSFALALRGGRNVTFGRFSTGPVAGLVLQDVRSRSLHRNERYRPHRLVVRHPDAVFLRHPTGLAHFR